MQKEAAGSWEARQEEGIPEMSGISIVPGPEHDIAIGVSSFKKGLCICSVGVVTLILILAGTAGAQVHHWAGEGPSPYDPAPVMGTDLGNGPSHVPAALTITLQDGQRSSKDLDDYLLIKGSARTARIRIRPIDPPPRSTRRPGRTQAIMDIEPTFEPGQPEGPVALDRPGVLDRIDSCKAIKGDMEEKGLHGPTRDLDLPGTSTILVTEADHSISHDGLGWEDHGIRSA